MPGLGAVSTTFIAGTIAIRKGLSEPIGSLTQMGSLRLGKRNENREVNIKDLVPLTDLEDIVFGGWDIFEDNCYEAALKAGVIDVDLLNKIKPELSSIKPMKAVFDKKFVKKLGDQSRVDQALQLQSKIADFDANLFGAAGAAADSLLAVAELVGSDRICGASCRAAADNNV